MTVIALNNIRYVRLGTRDAGVAVKFATEILGLELAGEDGGSIYLRSDERDHTLVYTPDAGHAVHQGTPSECEQRRVGAFVTFREPTGTRVDLVTRPWHSGRRYHAAREAGITGFSHVGLYSREPRRDEKFWTEICNARVSDWIGQAPLLRIDPVHHRIALFPAKRHGVQHINHQVESIDDVMRAYYFLRDEGVTIRFGPGRHPTSGAVFLYFEGPGECGCTTPAKRSRNALRRHLPRAARDAALTSKRSPRDRRAREHRPLGAGAARAAREGDRSRSEPRADPEDVSSPVPVFCSTLVLQ